MTELIGWLVVFAYLGISALASVVGPKLLCDHGLISEETSKTNSMGCLFAMFWPLYVVVTFGWKVIWPLLANLVPLLFTKGWPLIISVAFGIAGLIMTGVRKIRD